MKNWHDNGFKINIKNKYNAKKAATPKWRSGQAPYRSRGLRIDFREKEEGHSDILSRGLSYHSIGIDAVGLDFRVRNGTG